MKKKNFFLYCYNIDIDGTLLTPEGKLSERTKNVINKILEKNKDLHFVLASGRAMPATQQIRNTLNIIKRPNTESILSNGCVIYDSESNIIYQNTIPTEFFVKAHKVLKPSSEYTYMYSIGNDAFTYNEYWAKTIKEKYEEQTVVIDKDEFTKKIEMGEIKVNKFSILVKSSEEAENIEEKLDKLRKEYKLEYAYSAGTFVDYMPPDTNKGTGLNHLIKILNVKKEEVIAFGDGGNDIELLQSAGWPVAMENASNKLKSHAKLITKSNREDGVADLLEKVFLKD
ncbi:hypothetical protein BCR36DRAFT_297938 [Piromyces finnis]|uniref:HAD-like protein n=1 Tax=Piromyces finnis TaxID=1754191 RepID=A0A1Y1V3D6_9FUNG|nr:hypothetical protein BCR36DRAFT_297938 [Piromyces finnis]|eukprot:ORX46203.1 hypothetical protein BCR36DRAFT_297938 [Piromyces finnis]